MNFLSHFINKLKPEKRNPLLLSVPKFKIGDEVREIERNDVTGIVSHSGWHHKNQTFFYYLNVNGKKKSRRYDENELVLNV